MNNYDTIPNSKAPAFLTGTLALITLVLTLLWLGLLIADMATAGPLETFEQVAAHAAQLSWMYYTTYLNAALITLSATALFASMYVSLRTSAPAWSVIGLVFTPVYCLLNLVVYLSQVAVAPAWLALRADPAHGLTAELLLRHVLQAWPTSGAAFFNGLAYAILGIPSIIYGALLWKHPRALRWGGGLLALNGIACILGVMGYLTGSALLRMGTVAGGVLFLLALFPLTWGFFKQI